MCFCVVSLGRSDNDQGIRMSSSVALYESVKRDVYVNLMLSGPYSVM